MSADLLRRAASLMRERAEAATPGPWQVGEDVDSGERFIYDARWTELAQVNERSTGLGNPEHIASWHPAVALAVADWLEWVVEPIEDCILPFDAPLYVRALAVALAYLGEQA